MVCVTKLCVKDGVSKMVGDKVSEAPATQNDGGCEFVPRLPRDIKVNVTKCHACHVKRRWMSPSATPATQSGAAPLATNPDQARHTVP